MDLKQLYREETNQEPYQCIEIENNFTRHYVNWLEAKINYTRCCKSDSEQLKDLEVLSFEEWQEQNQELIRKSIGITGNEMTIELDLYSKYKTDQLLNL